MPVRRQNVGGSVESWLMSWMTIFTFLFAFACIATLLLGLQKQWQRARVISAVVAIVSFIMALVSASVKK